MSRPARAGIRTARALLSLIEENSGEDFEAAEAILGSEKELTQILQMLRKFKEHGEEPLTIERLREIVHRELTGLGLSPRDMITVANDVRPSDERLRYSPSTNSEDVVASTLELIEVTSDRPSAEVDMLVRLLIAAFVQAAQTPKLESLLRDLAVQALTENTIMFPTLHALAQLRARWTGNPLPYQHQEPRHALAARLVADAGQAASHLEHLRDLLREGMRGPADGAIAEVRGIKPKKAHGR